MQQDARLAVLESFGLTGYQARGYLALLDLGPIQAREVAERAQLPQGRVYDVLETLAARGLVEVLPEVPKRYRAMPFEAFLEQQLAEHRARAEALARDRDVLLRALEPERRAAPVRGEAAVLRGRRAVAERAAALLGEAAKEVVIVAPEAGLPCLLPDPAALADPLSRGTRVRLASGGELGSLPVGTEARRIGAATLVALGCYDRERALLTTCDPAGPEGDAAATAILVEEPRLAAGLFWVAEQLWAGAAPLPRRGLPPAERS